MIFCGWYSQSNRLHCLFVNRFNVKWRQISCWINSIRFFEEKRHVFLPRKNICVTFLTPFLLLHWNFIRTKCTNLSNEISSKVFLVFCVCLLFVDDFFALFYFISCHNMLLLKAIQSNWAKILQRQQAVGFVDKLSIYSLKWSLIVIVT